MTHYVLVHGGWHGGWCWSELITELERHGHEATAVELPSDRSGAGAQQYAQVIADAVPTPGAGVVVGHSLAGLALPLVPGLVEVSALVYLAALLPEPGRSWREQLSSSRPMTDWFHNHALPRQQRDEEGRSYWPPEVAAELFYHDCAPPVAADAAGRLRAQSATPVTEITPVQRFPDVTTHYLGCRADRAVSSTWQAATVPQRLGVAVTWIPGSHSPFLAAPAALAQTLTILGAHG